VEVVTTVSFNKFVAAGHFMAFGCGVPPFLPASRGGEEQDRCGAFCPGSPVPLAGRGGEEWRRRFSVALAPWSVPDPQVLGVVRAEQGRSLGLDSLPLPCRQGVGQAEIGRLWPMSLPLALGIVEGWACPWPSQAATSDDSKLRARRSYQ
jgi:hypothetical protein